MREEKENEKTIINSCTGRNDDIFIYCFSGTAYFYALK
jgi:hypothetical protein